MSVYGNYDMEYMVLTGKQLNRLQSKLNTARFVVRMRNIVKHEQEAKLCSIFLHECVLGHQYLFYLT